MNYLRTNGSYKVILRNLCIIRNGRNILLQRGSPSKTSWANYYNALGGHVQDGEDIHSSAVRETHEECGLYIPSRRMKLKGIVTTITYKEEKVCMFVYNASVKNKRIKDSEEGTLEWVDKNEIKLIDNIAQDLKIIIPLIDKLKANQIFVATSKFKENKDLEFFNSKVIYI